MSPERCASRAKSNVVIGVVLSGRVGVFVFKDSVKPPHGEADNDDRGEKQAESDDKGRPDVVHADTVHMN